MKYSAIILIACIFLTLKTYGQERLRPAQRYEAGDEVFAPILGMKTIIPEGWVGVLPRDTEVFLLMPLSGNGEIYVTGDSITADIMQKRWKQGMDLGNGNTLKSDGQIDSRGDIYTSDVILSKKTTSDKAYIEGKCSEFDRCIGGLLVSGSQDYERLKAGLQSFMDNVTFEAPSKKGLYDDFDWQGYLADKRLLHHTSRQGAKAENEIRLCDDGTFFMHLKRSGALKEDAKAYKGKNNGTWATQSIGPNGKLILSFEKLDDLQVDLRIDNDQVFLNNKRYFLMYGSTCR